MVVPAGRDSIVGQTGLAQLVGRTCTKDSQIQTIHRMASVMPDLYTDIGFAVVFREGILDKKAIAVQKDC